jgi:hypothetical protein
MKVMTPENTPNKQWEIRKSFKEVEDETWGEIYSDIRVCEMRITSQVKWVTRHWKGPNI